MKTATKPNPAPPAVSLTTSDVLVDLAALVAPDVATLARELDSVEFPDPDSPAHGRARLTWLFRAEALLTRLVRAQAFIRCHQDFSGESAGGTVLDGAVSTVGSLVDRFNASSGDGITVSPPGRDPRVSDAFAALSAIMEGRGLERLDRYGR